MGRCQGCAGRSFFQQGGAGRGGARIKIRRAVRGGAGQKRRVNQLIQKLDKSAQIVTGGFVLQYGILIKENITFSDF